MTFAHIFSCFFTLVWDGMGRCGSCGLVLDVVCRRLDDLRGRVYGWWLLCSLFFFTDTANLVSKLLMRWCIEHIIQATYTSSFKTMCCGHPGEDFSDSLPTNPSLLAATLCLLFKQPSTNASPRLPLSILGAAAHTALERLGPRCEAPCCLYLPPPKKCKLSYPSLSPSPPSIVRKRRLSSSYRTTQHQPSAVYQ